MHGERQREANQKCPVSRPVKPVPCRLLGTWVKNENRVSQDERAWIRTSRANGLDKWVSEERQLERKEA